MPLHRQSTNGGLRLKPRITGFRCVDRPGRLSFSGAGETRRLGTVACHVVDQDSTVSAVNYAEVLQKAARVGIVAEKIDSQMDAFGITVSPFNRLDVRLAASFYRHRSGLSLADRVCLALARSVASPAYTADRLWGSWAAELGVQVVVIRRGTPSVE